jgi:hypothetical protein
MGLKYLLQWTTAKEDSFFRDLRAISFSVDGFWLACCSSKCVFVLASATGQINTRIWYPKKATSILWLRAELNRLVCAYEDGTIITAEQQQDGDQVMFRVEL